MKVAIASGKGGTGKTTVAANLVKALNSSSIQALDCDVEEPNLHLFLNPEIKKEHKVNVKIPKVDLNKCNFCKKCSQVCSFNAITVIKDDVMVFPELCHSCGACSLLCPQEAIQETDRAIGTIQEGFVDKVYFVKGELNTGEVLTPPVIDETKTHIDRKKQVIIDSPPGTSCPVIESVRDTDYVVLVTEPTPFGMNDLKLAAAMCRKIGVPCGIVINRWGMGNNEVIEFAHKQKIPILLKIPYKKEFARCYARGNCIVDEYPQWKQKFIDLWNQIKEEVKR